MTAASGASWPARARPQRRPCTRRRRPTRRFGIRVRTGPGVLGDLHAFDPAALAWAPLPPAPASAPPPSPRQGHGLAAAGRLLYVFGGCDDDGARARARARARIRGKAR